jgi:phage terminase large subunit-like protein
MIVMKTPRKKTRAEKNIKWCQDYLCIPDGKHIGKPLVMAGFMQEDFKAIYDNPHGTRRAIITRGRKNAKTTECACIVLLHLCGREVKRNSHLYSCAQSREQAALIFNIAAKMVRMSPDLRNAVAIRDTKKELYCPDLGTAYKALSAEASTAYGLNPALCIHDELGQTRGPNSELYEALETATAAQEDPLTIIISTQAPTDSDLLSILIDDAKAAHDPKTVLRMQTAPPEIADPFSEEAIRAANPAFDVFMNRDEVLAMAEDARRMPARQAEYENLVLNRRVEVNNPFIAPQVWRACSGEVGPLTGIPLYGGLDLSETADLTALVLMGWRDLKWRVHSTFWLPANIVEPKSTADRVPYTLWARQGYLQTTPGNTVSYEHVANHLRTLFNQYSILKLGFDRWNFRHFKPWLLKAGFNEMFITDHFVEFGQGMQSMSPALRELEQIVLDGNLVHGDHPVLQMCVSNAIVVRDDAGNRKLSKRKSIGRIDGAVALAMAVGVAPLRPKAIDVEAMIA